MQMHELLKSFIWKKKLMCTVTVYSYPGPYEKNIRQIITKYMTNVQCYTA